MINFKGIKAYNTIAFIMLSLQMLKLTNFIRSMELATFIAVFLTIILTIKVIIFDKKLHGVKYWLLLAVIFAQEVLVGLDKILPTLSYIIVITCMSNFSLCVLFSLDAPSVRKKMDDDAYVLKNTCTLLTITYVIAMSGILMNYLFPPYFLL
ncbi:MAG: hypothetical protein II644_04200 [Paludibacteraceae bacterium]|nr:hypothetical protein [Paludibacteraceae bacterium]